MKTQLRLLLILTALQTLAATWPSWGDSEDDKRDLVRRYVELCLNGSELTCFEEYWQPGSVEKVRDGHELRLHLFPDLRYELVELFVDGDRVAAVFEVHGRHSSAAATSRSPTASPESRRLETEEVALYTVSGGRIRSGRIIADRMDVAEALGYAVKPPGSHR